MQVQLTRCQQFLIFELHQFVNIYNAEITNDGFCCCDKNNNKKCKARLQDLPKCATKCDTWFNISLSPCESPHPCWRSTPSSCKDDGTSVLNFEHKSEFVLCGSPDIVSANKLCIVNTCRIRY